MKFADKELILFDLDGTLIDSAPDLALSVNFMLRSIERSEFSDDIIDSWVGNGASVLVRRALSGSVIIDDDIDDILFEKALSVFLDYYKKNLCVKTIIYPGVKKTLETLKQNNHKLAIVTNKPFDFIEPILTQLELDDLFCLYIGGDSLSHRKPHPSPLLHVCQQLDTKIENSVMIGDSKNDILAAKSAQIHSVGVSYGYNYGEDIRIYNPDVVVDDFSDILELFI